MNEQIESDMIWSSRGKSVYVHRKLDNVKHATFRFRYKDGDTGEILRISSAQGSVLEAVRDERQMNLRFYTKEFASPLLLSLPSRILADESRGRDIMIGYRETNLELFLDGVLIDEDWPFGGLNLNELEVMFAESVLEAWVIARALTVTEVEEASGGADQVRQHELAYLGSAEDRKWQYWRPRGHNTGVGDCMPFYDGRRFHIYYLFDRKSHKSKWGVGAHQWAHASTADLSSWEEHPLAIGITHEWEGSICTGSLLFESGLYYAFYSVRMYDRSKDAKLTWATSTDGIHFTKSEAVIPLSPRYRLRSVRDPEVFKDGAGTFHMLVTTAVQDGDAMRGCLAHLTSPDLKSWHEEEPFIVPGYNDEPECPNLFEWNGWYYLLFSNHGVARYRFAESLTGPWIRPESDLLDCPQYRVPKTAAFPGGRRRLAAGFQVKQGYGGQLVWREMVQREDGTLGMKFVEEFTKAISRSAVPLERERFSLPHTNGFSEVALGPMPEQFWMECTVLPASPQSNYGFSIGCSENLTAGWDIRFEPGMRKIGVHSMSSRSWEQNEEASIYAVADLEKPVKVEAMVGKDFVDLCINGSRTLISSIEPFGRNFRFFSQFGATTFDNVAIYSVE